MGTMYIDACRTCKGHCYACFYADECLRWQDVYPYTPAKVAVGCARLALCESRHAMPEKVEGSIFPETVNPTDIMYIRATANKALKSAVKANGIKCLVCYVTGLTVALVEVINWCRRNDVNLVLMHFNRETGEYYPQELD